MVVLYISCAVDPQSNTPPDSNSAASYFGGVTDWEIRRRITRSGWTTGNAGGSIRICCSCISGPEEPEQEPPSPVYIPYVPEPVYPEYIPPEDDVFPAEEQPLPAAALPTADSPGYIPESDPDEDPEDDDIRRRIQLIIPLTMMMMMRRSPLEMMLMRRMRSRTRTMMMRRRSTQLRSTLFHLHQHFVADRPEVTLPPRKRLSIVHCPGYEAGESSVAAVARPIEGHRADYGFVDFVEAEIRRQRADDIRYGIRDTWIDPRDVAEEEALMTLEGVNTRVTELAAVQEQDTQDIYRVMEDTQGRQTEIFQRVEALVQDQRIDALDTLIATLATQLSSLQGHLATALGEIRVLQAREQARAGAPEGTGSTHDANQTGDDSHTSGTGVRRTERVFRECTYQDFMKCQPLYFKGTEGVVKLTQWFERMETVFRISNYLAENQTKFATCTLLAGALTWWNSHFWIVGNDAAYELALLCVRTCPEDSNRVERCIGGLLDTIYGSVVASKPKTMQEATEMATGLMDKKIRTYAERQAANKRKFEDTSRNNQSRQQPPKRQDVARAYAAGSDATSATRLATYLVTVGARQMPMLQNNQRGNGVGQKFTCYECGAQGHFKRYCLKLKNNNNNSGNQVGTRNAQARVYAVGNAGTNPNANTVTDHDYAVELADGRIVGVNTVTCSCTLNFLNHPFNIDLMSVEMGSIDVIIDMDWLSIYQAVIVCADKIVRIPWGRETLIFHGNGSNQEHET
nr:hypothetical protein [Tanacetum cinerariifolium]